VGELLIVFAKAPVPGRVKTRLTGRLGAEGAAGLHEAMVATVLAGLGKAHPELHSDIETDSWPRFRGPRRLQSAGDLGERMYAALDGALRCGHARATLVGSDSPLLGWGHLRRLMSARFDVLFGPARDGGFWGVSARRTAPAMFQGVGWSQSDTLRQSILACRRSGLSVGLAGLLPDVDDPRDFAGLYRYLDGLRSPPLRRFLRRASKSIKVIHF
jgi:hypothetical protein